jgi:hypothetical protein
MNAGYLEERLGHVGANLDSAIERISEGLEEVRARLDDLRVKAGLAKLETRERVEPIVDDLRDRTAQVRSSLVDLREQLMASGDALKMGLEDAAEDMEVAVEAATHTKA